MRKDDSKYLNDGIIILLTDKQDKIEVDITRNPRKERLCDGLAFRTTPSQRRFIEKQAEDHKIPICEEIRLLIDDAMARTGAVKC